MAKDIGEQNGILELLLLIIDLKCVAVAIVKITV
tara:strand:- start:340 stop:441 length:102 start_codon:yes stop_codon:yes gene_type:complete